jgi:hypothetical protein
LAEFFDFLRVVHAVLLGQNGPRNYSMPEYSIVL